MGRMSAEQAIEFIREVYTPFFGKDEKYGRPEWQIRYMPGMDKWRVRCNEPDKCSNTEFNGEMLEWISGWNHENYGALKWHESPGYLCRPDFKVAYMSRRQIVMLAHDLELEMKLFKEEHGDD